MSKISTLALLILAAPAPAAAHGPSIVSSPAVEAPAETAPAAEPAAAPSARGDSAESRLPAYMLSAAERNRVPAPLLHGIVMVESGYNCRAHHGPWLGIGQITRQTARGVGITGNLFDCATGIEAAARYARLALDRSGGDWHGAATLYNAGVYASPHRTAYSYRVMRYAKALGETRPRVLEQ